jgi:hypothetical protein
VWAVSVMVLLRCRSKSLKYGPAKGQIAIDKRHLSIADVPHGGTVDVL